MYADKNDIYLFYTTRIRVDHAFYAEIIRAWVGKGGIADFVLIGQIKTDMVSLKAA